MNPLSLRALWKGLRGRSLTFSIIFAMAIMGSSFAGLLRAPLRTIGIWGPLVLLLPIIVTGLLAKHEHKLSLSVRFRQLCSYTLIFGSIVLAVLLWRYENRLEETYANSFEKGPLFKEEENPVRRRGPRRQALVERIRGGSAGQPRSPSGWSGSGRPPMIYDRQSSWQFSR